MIRLLIDVNVVVDVMFVRTPHLDASRKIWRLIENGKIEAYLAAHAVTTLHYLIRQQAGALAAKRALADILPLFQVAAVDRGVLTEALLLDWPDFEDAVTAVAAGRSGCAAVVARDSRGFRHAEIPVLSPEAAYSLAHEHL